MYTVRVHGPTRTQEPVRRATVCSCVMVPSSMRIESRSCMSHDEIGYKGERGPRQWPGASSLALRSRYMSTKNKRAHSARDALHVQIQYGRLMGHGFAYY